MSKSDKNKMYFIHSITFPFCCY